MKMKTKTHCAGFTLVELMIVILIMGIALMIVAANFGDLIPNERIRSEARAIGNLIGLARAEAAMKGINYGIVYDLDNNAFWLLVPELEGDELSYYDGDEEYDDDEEEEIRKKLFYRQLHEDVEFEDIQVGEKSGITDNLVRIEISPIGIASGHIVHLKEKKKKDDTKEKQISIELNALTALVTYFDGYKEFKEVIDFED
ncbi:MAG: prepilin-type N-terminal cleavage/methylation domain-containing protein [Planctomycetes bacterium]|nr:prepilin-type N-terminal cleavage/methylation domain-containing protein [Planctomycetota bacterium]